MIHRCASCPGIESFEAYLKRELQRVDPGKMPLSDEIGAVNYCDESETSTDDEDNDLDEISIEFNQWTTKDRSMLTSQTVSAKEIQSTRENIRERLSQAKTVPGTRSFHQFIPISSSIIGAKRVSEEVDFALRFSFGEEQLEGVEARVGQFVVCNYDELYWAGMLIEVDNDMHDVNVKFMHPSLPSTSLKWPKRDDTCWVPKTKILFKIEPPTLSTHTGRQYILDGKDRDRIDRCLQRM
eukprot:gene1888-biopygen10418